MIDSRGGGRYPPTRYVFRRLRWLASVFARQGFNMSEENNSTAAAVQELAVLKKQLRKARWGEWISRRKAAFFAGSHRSADARKAIPIASLLRTSQAMVLAASAIGGSGVGFIVGHALLGWQGASAAIPLFGVIAFFVVARFAFNGSLLSSTALLQKSEEESANAEKWQATAQGVAELIPAATARTEDAKKKLPVITVSPATAPITPEVIKPQVIAQSWETLPPTEKQIGFARHLGIRLTGREGRGEVSSLIDIQLAKRAATREAEARQQYRGMQIAPNPGIAMLFNIFWPGVGQVYQGRAFSGLFLMFATPVGYLLIVPGMILHFIAIVDAAFYRPKIR